MPVEFLTEDQQRRYGCYTEEPSPLQLARYFHFDDRDHQLIARRQSDHTRLGFALQLGTVRFLGTFLPDPTEVPASVVAYVAQQLGIPDVSCLARYRTRDTHWDQVVEIHGKSRPPMGCGLSSYLEAVLTQLQTEGMEGLAADVAQLSFLVHQRLNFQGRYSFALTESVAQGVLRPLHDPDELEA